MCIFNHDENLKSGWSKGDYLIEEAKRIYVRVSHNYKRKYVPFGWICPNCHLIVLDNDMPNLRGSYEKNKKELMLKNAL